MDTKSVDVLEEIDTAENLLQLNYPEHAKGLWNARLAVAELIEAVEDYLRPQGKLAEIVASQERRLGRLVVALSAVTPNPRSRSQEQES